MEREEKIQSNEDIISKRRIENEDINNNIIKKTKCDSSNDNSTDHTIFSEDKNCDIFGTEVEKEKIIIDNCNINNDGNVENINQNIIINENLVISSKESINDTMNHFNANNILNEQNNSLNTIENNEKENNIIRNINKKIEVNQNQIEIEIENSNSCTEMEATTESTYQFPTYNFKMENTLNSTNTFYNPRCSTQNDFNDNTILNNYFKGAKW